MEIVTTMRPTKSTTHNSRNSKKMNWTATDVHHSSSYFHTRTVRLPFAVCFILVCIYLMPMVSCRSMDNTENDNFQLQQQQQQQQNFPTEKYTGNVLFEKSDNNEMNLTPHNQKRKIPYYIHPADNEWSHIGQTNLNENGEKNVKKIKGKFRKRFRNKNKYNKDKLQQNYNDDEILKRFHSTMKNTEMNGGDFKYIESDKKYFDYFPIEKLELNSNETEIDDNIEVVFLSHDDNGNRNSNKKQHKKKSKKFSDITTATTHDLHRSKRSAEAQLDNSIRKRNIAASNRYLQDNIFTIDQGSVVPNGNLIRKNRDEIGGGLGRSVAEENGHYYSYGTGHDPWNNRFSKPVNNLQVPFIKYPIRGIYYNPISPPGNFPVGGRRPSTTDTGADSIGNRFGEDEDRVIWDIHYSKGVLSQARPAFSDSSRRPIQPTTRRPSPPLIHSPSRDKSGNDDDLTSVLQNTNSNNPASATANRNPPRTSSPPLIRRTTIPATTTTTLRSIMAQRPIASPPRRTEPSKCVWSIVSCCSRDNLQVRYACFEQNGCHGAFWDLNPCADEIQDAALEQAEKFFDTNNNNK